MSALVASNLTLRDDAALLRDRLNTSGVLQLFNNNFQPLPGSIRTEFTRASYGGYAPQMLIGAFSDPIKVFDGIYVIRTASIPWHVVTANGQTVYGWFIQYGDNIHWAQRFDTPIFLTNGLDFSFAITIQVGSISVVCP